MATAKKGGSRSGAKSSARGGASKKSATKKTASARKAPARGASAKKGATKTRGAAKKGAAKKATKRAPNPAFMKPMTPSPTLAAVIGNNPMPRTEVTKRLWAYIKKNNLQDPKERRMINADDKLRPLFGKSKISMFDMTKVVNQNLS